MNKEFWKVRIHEHYYHDESFGGHNSYWVDPHPVICDTDHVYTVEASDRWEATQKGLLLLKRLQERERDRDTTYKFDKWGDDCDRDRDQITLKENREDFRDIKRHRVKVTKIIYGGKYRNDFYPEHFGLLDRDTQERLLKSLKADLPKSDLFDIFTFKKADDNLTQDIKEALMDRYHVSANSFEYRITKADK